MKPTIEQYATKEEIIHALAPYKQDEVVTLLGKVTMVTKLSHREKKYEKLILFINYSSLVML